MCLSTKMSAKKKAEFKEQTEGYKVLRIKGDTLVGDIREKDKVRPENQWLYESGYRQPYFSHPTFSNTKPYPYGWHIFLTLKGAQRWRDEETLCLVIRKVAFKNPVAYGWQFKLPCVVAKEMMILKEAQ